MVGCKGIEAFPNCSADFSNAIIDNIDLLWRLTSQKSVRNVPNVIRNRDELNQKLRERKLSEPEMDGIMKLSVLPK